MKKRQIIAAILTIGLLALSNKLWLIPQENAHSQVEIHILLIILICGYLLAYKITSYLADFKTFENKSRIEIFFLTLFFTILFIPMMHIDNRPHSIFDRRYLSPKPHFFENNRLNYKFGTEFNNWFTDRFLTRKAVIKALNDVKSFISFSGYSTEYIQNKKFNFLYNKDETSGINIKREKDQLKYIEQFDKFCKDHGIKLYTIIVPDKISVYSIPDINYKDREFYEIINKEREEKKINIIFPSEELKREAKNDYVYFKTDHHWTDSGAFVGYQEVMKLIKRDFPQVKVLTKDNFTYFTNRKVRSDFDRKFRKGHTCQVYNIPKYVCNKYLKTDYIYFKHKDIEKLQTIVTDEPYHLEKKFYYPKGADLRVILLGTSMNENLTEMVPFTFKNVYRIRTNNIKNITPDEETKIMKYHKKDILDYKPDIIIFCIGVGNMYKTNDFFKMN